MLILGFSLSYNMQSGSIYIVSIYGKTLPQRYVQYQIKHFTDCKSRFIVLYLHTNLVKMLKLIVLCLILIAISVILLSVNLLFKKNGRFPNTHVSGNKEMRKRGIGCVQSQDAAMRRTNPRAIRERSK